MTDLNTAVRGTARHPAFTGTETISWANVATTFQAYRDGYYQQTQTTPPTPRPATIADAPAAMRRWIASKTLLGDGTATTTDAVIFFPVVNPRTDKLNEGALRSVLSGRGAQAHIPATALASAQAQARRLLNAEFDANLATQADAPSCFRTAIQAILAFATGREEAETPITTHLTHDDLRLALYAQLAARRGQMYGPDVILDVLDGAVIYRDGERLFQQAYTVDSANAVTLTGEASEVQRDTRYVPVATHEPLPAAEAVSPSAQEEPSMATKVSLIQALIAHPQTTWAEADTPLLDAMTEEQLTRLTVEASRQPAAASPAADPVTAESIAALVRAELDARDQAMEARLTALVQQRTETTERTQLMVSLVAQGFTEEECAGMPLETVRKMARTFAPTSYAGMGLPSFPVSGENDAMLPADAPTWE